MPILTANASTNGKPQKEEKEKKRKLDENCIWIIKFLILMLAEKWRQYEKKV